MKLLNNDRLLIPSIVTHVFFSFIIISCIIGFLLTQKYSENVIITSINFINLSFASMIVGIIVKEKWKYRVYKTSPMWLAVFTFKLITTPAFEMFMSNYSLNIMINFILSVIFFITLVTKRLFLKYFIIGMVISVILAIFAKYIVLQKDIEQYYFFLQNEIFIIFSCVVKILGILILIYYRQIENELKIETLRTFSNVVAYEIFTPLALIETILGVINASTADNSTKEKVLSLLRTCRNARDKINFLIENTKLIGGIKSFTTTSISVCEVLTECIEEYQAKDFEVVFVAHNDIQFFGCKNIMRCVIHNILNNAFQHGGENTKVEVLISGNYLIFQDNGNGIKASNLNSIFDIFSTSTKHNLGIGLTICKDIIKSYGGEISCISLEGSHATFIIKFPII